MVSLINFNMVSNLIGREFESNEGQLGVKKCVPQKLHRPGFTLERVLRSRLTRWGVLKSIYAAFNNASKFWYERLAKKIKYIE